MSARNKTYLRHANETAATAAACASAAGFVAEVEVLEARRNESSSPPRLRDVDLIVVGSRGLGPIAGALLGSVSREIVDQADRPVLVAGSALRSTARSLTAPGDTLAPWSRRRRASPGCALSSRLGWPWPLSYPSTASSSA
jgi:universal stress protein family protein